MFSSPDSRPRSWRADTIATEHTKTAGSSSSDNHVAMPPTPLKYIFFVPSSSNPSLTMTVELPCKESSLWPAGAWATQQGCSRPSCHALPRPQPTLLLSPRHSCCFTLLFQYLILLAFLTDSLLSPQYSLLRVLGRTSALSYPKPWVVTDSLSLFSPQPLL